MKSVLNKEIKTLFLHKDSNFNIDCKYNIILSPEFYWSRIFDIPAKSKAQIKKTLPTLFEDIIPDEEYLYHAINIEEKRYICFAYKSEEIIEYLKKSNLNINKLNNIYFAQTELSKFAPFKIDDKAFVQKDETLIKIPPRFLNDNTADLNIKNITLSRNKINLNIHQNIINTKNIYFLSSIFLILILINFFTIYSINSEINSIDKNKEKLVKNHNLPTTSIQLNSMINSLNKTNIEQNKIRTLIKDILSIYKKNSKVKIIQIQHTNKFLLTLENISFNQTKNLLKKYKIKEVENRKNLLKVEIKI